MTTISSEHIKQCALEVGFHACGIAKASHLSDFESTLGTWLSLGFGADMQYMQRNSAKRSNPRLLYLGARSVISLLLSYNPSRVIDGPYKIARYAYSDDYHLRIKRMLFELIAALQLHYPDFKARPFVDTAPISDKRWAAAAGLGWIGRNSLLISPQYGSFCNIGEIVTEFEVDRYDEPLANHCGNCRLCLQSCPNHALQLVDGRYMLNAACCTAYNTIENRQSALPDTLHTHGYAFGCDICQEVCPYNADAPCPFEVSDEKISRLQGLFYANESQFNHAVRHTPISRITFNQWRRNFRHVCSDLQKNLTS